MQVRLKIGIDVFMTALLLCAMGYMLIGEEAHEWIGCALFVLFATHHILNRNWWQHLRRGKYAPVRIVQTGLNFLILLAMLGAMVSGVLLSRYVFDFDVTGLANFAHALHILSAYWGFALMSVHLGLHWGMLCGRLKKAIDKKKRPAWFVWLLRIAAFCIAAYGAVNIVRYDLFSYMFLQSHFVFFDAEQPVVLFLLDYAAIMGFWVWLTCYAQKLFNIFYQKRRTKK